MTSAPETAVESWKQFRFRLRFHTPAFLGNASQQAQWRTPPIKALLRQWWRVAYAADKRFAARVDEMRHAEGILFGHAWLEEDFDWYGNKAAARKGQVRLRLGHWNEGKLKNWASTGKAEHPEVKNREGRITPIGSDLYLGYGPLAFANGATALKSNAAIQAGDSAALDLAVPDKHSSIIGTALMLVNLYGTLGGRSRNGWGSFSLTPADERTSPLPPALPSALLQRWQDALHMDWPHAIGSDARGALIWRTAAFDDWKSLIQELARLKIGLRTQFTFTTGKDSSYVEDRHWLSYPVTHHSVRAWGSNARLPNSLRLKVRPAPGDAQKVVGVIFHVPCLPPPAFQPDLPAITRVWQRVHAFLDRPEQKLTRIPA